MRDIVIETIERLPVHRQRVEIVERKGIGHPDYICDALAERVSIALSREYLNRFGKILHFNIDKGLLVAGRVERSFGGGRVIQPMEFILGDRAVLEVDGERLDVEELAIETSRTWIRENLRNVDPVRDIRFRIVLSPGSEELTSIFKKEGLLGANDTSAAVGYAPLTITEATVLNVERHLNSRDFKTRYPFTGEDVKVMGLRKDKELILTIAMPFLARYIGSEEEYFRRKKEVEEDVRAFLREPLTGMSSSLTIQGKPFEDVKVCFNTLDERGRGLDGIYLSLLGTSAEDADSGQVGRGNRVNGIIPLNRPMSTEAAAGKNPLSHVGKIYNILSHRLAQEIYRKVGGMEEVYVWLLSQIGNPVDQPLMVSVQVVGGKKVEEGEIVEVVESEFSRMEGFCRGLIMGSYPVC